MSRFQPDRELLRAEQKGQYFEKVKALEVYLATVAEQLRSEGVPADASLRVNMEAFSDVYRPAEIARDNVIVESWQREYHPDISPESRQGEELKTDGTQLEMLKSAILHKQLQDKFIICRTSLYDDIKNGVDNIIIDRASGRPVCALDEVGDINGTVLEKKKEIVLKKNFNKDTQGSSLRYGLWMEDTKGNRTIKKGKISHIPTFYLSLPRDYIRKGIELFNCFGDPSEHEKKLFAYFLATLYEQVHRIELDTAFDRMPDEFCQAEQSFKKALATISGIR